PYHPYTTAAFKSSTFNLNFWVAAVAFSVLGSSPISPAQFRPKLATLSRRAARRPSFQPKLASARLSGWFKPATVSDPSFTETDPFQRPWKGSFHLHWVTALASPVSSQP